MDKKAVKNNLDLLLGLIKIYLSEDKASEYLNYFQRIISSKMPLRTSQNPTQLMSLISRRVDKSKFQKILSLSRRLEAKTHLAKTKEMLLLLFKLSEDKSEFLPGLPLSTENVKTYTSPVQVIENIEPKAKPSLENALIRDILFTFQGVEGNYLNFSTLEDRFVIRKEISQPVKQSVEALAETGWFYKKIRKFISNYEHYPSIVCQSFCASLKSELKEYYRLIALLEGQNNSKLKQIELWCEEPLERMRWLAVICEAVEGLTGGNFISAVFSYSKYGNPSVRVLVNRILDSVSEKYIEMIERWMVDGELSDTYKEFFVGEDIDTSEDQLWARKYQLIVDLAPGFMSKELVELVFLTGKSINFIRKCCAESWKSESPLDLPKLRDFPAMKNWIKTSSELTNSKLIRILLHKYRFIENSECIRKYLLMAQGDFHHYLMEQLNEALNKPDRGIYKHNLASILENAIRASNAQNENLELLNKLSIRLEEPGQLETVWDVFVLKFQVESPLNSIFSEQVMGQYSIIFKLFWKIKRVHFYINSFQNEREMVKLLNMKGAGKILRKCQMLKQEIMHFVNNLYHYLMVEVQEGAWNQFINSVKTVSDLDQLILVHQKFLDIILERAFLSQENERIKAKLLSLLAHSLAFKTSQETLINSVIEESQRRSLRKQPGNDLRHSLSLISNESVKDIERISRKFAAEIQVFRKMLSEADKTHLRFLAFRLDFNEFYTNKIT